MYSLASHELASVIDNFLPAFNAGSKLPAHKLRVLDAIQKCRTWYMGGHIDACTACGELRMAHNSCRNRHCPKCGGIDKEKWILNREQDLIPVKYFHLVFTVPQKLNSLFINNQQTMYNLLFATAWDVLREFGQDRNWIGGKMGASAILHTSGQNLQYHPHLHFIVPGGALMLNGIWKHSRSNGKYLFNVKQLSRVFQARLVAGLRILIKEKKITGKEPSGLFDKNWVVYAKQPFGGPQQVINYLGRYTHRTAISNNRIVEVTNQYVTFKWNDYNKNYAKRITTVSGGEFLRLFCMHILPPGFTRIRHYGFLSSASKSKSLAIIRTWLKVVPVENQKPTTLDVFQKMGINPGVCKCCGGLMVIIEILPNQFRMKNIRAPPDNNVANKILNKLKIES